MEYTVPHYFERFRCTASDCTDTCCAGWAIMIDEQSLERYKTLEGAFGERVRHSVNWEEGCFCQSGKRCAFLKEDNLCELYLEGGEELLCDTCRDYPRHMEEFEGLREASLSISCMEAAKLVLGCEEPVRFITLADDREEEPYEEFDCLLFTKLMDTREAMIKLLQNREIDIMVRIGMALELGQKLQKAIEEETLFQMDEELREFGVMNTLFAFQKKEAVYQIGEHEYCAMMRKLFRTFTKLEVLNEAWLDDIRKAERILFMDGQRTYEEHRQAFHKIIGLKGINYQVWSRGLEQLAVYYIYTYFCGAVYDGQALGKIKLAAASVLFVQELCIAAWVEQREAFDFVDFVEIAHRFSREIEHSDVNLARMEKLFEKSPLFETEQMIRLLLYAA